jgi:hypothetical protein
LPTVSQSSTYFGKLIVTIAKTWNLFILTKTHLSF